MTFPSYLHQQSSFQTSYAQRQPRFNGLSDLAARAVGVIGSNRNVEMTGTDVTTMIAPRTGLAFWKRGADDGRETGFRELSGLFGNMFAIGTFSYLGVRLLGTHVNRLNPHGMPGRAYINSQSLEAFGTLMEEVLADESVTTPKQAQEKLLQKVLAGLQSSDHTLQMKNLTESAGVLPPEHRAAYIDAVKRQVPEGRLNTGLQDALTQAYLTGNMGSLSGDGSKSAAGHSQTFSQQAHEMVDAEQRVLQERGLDARKFDPRVKFLKHRLRLSQNDLHGPGKDFLNLANQTAGQGLTDEVSLGWTDAATGKTRTLTQKRKTLLGELQHFKKQFMDRALSPHDVAVWQERAGKAGRDIDWKTAAREMLYAKSAKRSLLHWLPQLDDGLISATQKSKLFWLTIPFGLTIVFTTAMAFVNNWWTKRKHGGKAFFPGEMTGTQQLNSGQSAPASLPGGSSAKPVGSSATPNAPGGQALPPAASPTAPTFPGNPALQHPQGFSRFQSAPAGVPS